MTDGQPTIALVRGANIFAADPERADRLEKLRQAVLLAPDQLLHPDVPAAYVVRLGKLRVSQFLPDGREITRAVLQAGAVLATAAAGRDADPGADVYILPDIVLMALGEAELWRLPPDALNT
jgi:CRP-like cAMP-binding protein